MATKSHRMHWFDRRPERAIYDGAFNVPMAGSLAGAFVDRLILGGDPAKQVGPQLNDLVVHIPFRGEAR